MNEQKYLNAMRSEIRPALGCTEPVAVALAVAKARETLGCMPEKIVLRVSANILKNAMGVGIPGTGMVGLEVATALSCIAGRSTYGLEVLSAATQDDCQNAAALAKAGIIKVETKDTPKKLYIEAELSAAGHTAMCIIEDAHTQITHVQLDDKIIESMNVEACPPSMDTSFDLTVAGIWEFITTVDVEKLDFLKEVIAVNSGVAREGLRKDYGMRVGRVLMDQKSVRAISLTDYVCAFTAAAADARMAGCTMSVMSTCGSGNQGITASLPVAAAAEWLGESEEKMLRAEALSQLITVHIKKYIGKLSPLCGCAIAASIGSSCGIAYLMGGDVRAIVCAIQNMIADISGLICDGAKPGCALKIASSVASAMQCAQLALNGISAGNLDGIVTENVEKSIHNLGNLGNAGMERTDRVILDMMISK